VGLGFSKCTGHWWCLVLVLLLLVLVLLLLLVHAIALAMLTPTRLGLPPTTPTRL
jgi:hypothetical protein